METVRIAPQPGPQTEFLRTSADIAIYGGAAGGGKSYALLLHALKHKDNEKFAGVIFRRNATQVRNPGGLWDESSRLYPLLQAKSREISLEWTFQSGMRMKFAHLEYEKTVLDWQGAQVPYIGFDELTHFTESQFWYMLSRNRSVSGVPGRIRATTNPDADSWVRKLIDWWIDPVTGFPIPERSGKIRYFIRLDNTLHWGDSVDELRAVHGPAVQPKSLTFIGAKLSDNKILMENDPGYLANLMAMARIERSRYHDGNWNTRADAGTFFQRHWFPVLDNLGGITVTKSIRYWDRAATRPSETNPDPDWSVGLKLCQTSGGAHVITDIVRIRGTPLEVENLVLHTARVDGYDVAVGLEQDPGSAGVADVDNMVRKLAGFNIMVNKPTKAKTVRAMPVSAQAERGQIMLIRAPWNDAFLSEAQSFPVGESGHDDQVDCLSGAFAELTKAVSTLDVPINTASQALLGW